MERVERDEPDHPELGVRGQVVPPFGEQDGHAEGMPVDGVEHQVVVDAQVERRGADPLVVPDGVEREERRVRRRRQDDQAEEHRARRGPAEIAEAPPQGAEQ